MHYSEVMSHPKMFVEGRVRELFGGGGVFSSLET